MEIMIPIWQKDAGSQLAKSDLSALKGTTVACRRQVRGGLHNEVEVSLRGGTVRW